MGVVLALSAAPMSAENTGSILGPVLAWLGLGRAHVHLLHGLVRKAAHVTEYAILAALWRHAFVRGGMARPAVASALALAISVACAVVDETNQSFLPTRTGAVGDVGLDSLGALAAVVAAQLGWRRAVDMATGVLLWVAVIGGLGALALDLAAGAGGGVLWLTVPAAAVLVVYRRWRSTSRT
jgi:VanZ family protein